MTTANTAPTDYLAHLEAWKTDRLAKLTAADGWLNITDRLWLHPGHARVGSAPGNDLVLSTGPDFIGTLIQDDESVVSFLPADGSAAITLKPDPKTPPRFTAANLLLEITSTNGENALRVRDTTSPRIREFTGLDYFPADPSWRIVAEWVAFDTPMELTINTSKSIPSDVKATHKAVFHHDGKRYELIATHGTAEHPQFVLRDQTSKDETYPAARFLFGEDLTETTIVLDFNKAYNPPCSFTEHAVCPLPPQENILPFAIRAGEKRHSFF